MEFTFGIITSGNNDVFMQSIVSSIESENIPTYEIIIIGSSSIVGNHIKVVPFDEHIRHSWITRKKNLITEMATYENIVYMHDYIALEPGWYKGWLEYMDEHINRKSCNQLNSEEKEAEEKEKKTSSKIVDNTFCYDACMNRIINADGSRYRDWILSSNSEWPQHIEIDIPFKEHLLPYTENRLTKYMYFSGAYWVARKSCMLDVKLDEDLVWGQGEDVYWSYHFSRKYNFSMNAKSAVRLLKYKDPVYHEMSGESLRKIQFKLKLLQNES